MTDSSSAPAYTPGTSARLDCVIVGSYLMRSDETRALINPVDRFYETPHYAAAEFVDQKNNSKTNIRLRRTSRHVTCAY